MELRIARSENLPVLPEVAHAILKIADITDVPAREIEQLILRDPAVAAKVLRVASSPRYGSGQIGSIVRAIHVLGMQEVRSLVVNLSFRQLLVDRTQCAAWNKQDFWRHSLAVASGAQALCALLDQGKAHDLYNAGLMHDIGQLVMDRYFPEVFEDALRVAKIERVPLYCAERNLCGFDHAAVGGLLAEKWNLAPVISSTIRFHHDAEADEQFGKYSMMLAAANSLAVQAGFASNSSVAEAEIAPNIVSGLGLPEEQYKVIISIIERDVRSAQEAFSMV